MFTCRPLQLTPVSATSRWITLHTTVHMLAGMLAGMESGADGFSDMNSRTPAHGTEPSGTVRLPAPGDSTLASSHPLALSP